MRADELKSISNKLEQSLEAVEKLQDEKVFDDDGILYGDISSLKGYVEKMLEEEKRKEVDLK